MLSCSSITHLSHPNQKNNKEPGEIQQKLVLRTREVGAHPAVGSRFGERRCAVGDFMSQ
ncbi:hypothetical protein ACWDT6_08000 [Nocardia grenadensis]